LSRQLVRKLVWQDVKGLGVVAVTGRLDAEPVNSPNDERADENAKKKLKMLKTEDFSPEPTTAALAKPVTATPSVPILDIIPRSTTSPTRSQTTNPIHIGDLRLSSLRQLLNEAKHVCEFRGEGTLLIDGTVVVRKSASGRVEVEGDVRGLEKPGWRTGDGVGSFFAVRRSIYAGLGVVGGGGGG